MAALMYKDDHNKLAYLGRERGCEDFTDILSYLDHSPLRYALTHDPSVVFDFMVKQFWATAIVRPNAAGSHDLVATIDGREVVVTESLIRTQLHFDDANGIFDMPINDILEGMRVIGYPTDRTLTFLKHHLSPQWRFLVHTIMHCLSPKSGSWNQFPSSIATALICLSTGRVYNFSRFILEGMIGNLKATKHKFLMYPRFLQMIVALETADRTPRPTFDFTRKIFANMKFKWEGQPIPLTTPMLAIAAAGNDAAGGDDAANEDNAAANEAAGSAAEAHLVPHSPPVSPVREPTPERQPVSERPPSPSPTIPETEWVVPNPVSPVSDWRPWPYVPVHSPIRDPTPEPVSPPTPPAQTFIFEEPLVFGPEPRPAGYVDPDVIEPIIFGPQPRPHGYVDPDFVEPIIFGPQPRPDNYLEPEDLDNIISMEDDTTHGGFHVESPVRPDDAPTPTADAAGRAEDPALLTALSAKLDRCMGRIDSLETELGKSKKTMGGAILTLVSRVKKLEKTVKQLRETRLVVDASAAEGDVDIQDDIDLDGLSRMASTALGHDQPAVPSEDVEEREEEEVPLRRKRSAYRRTRTEFSTPAFEQFQANLSAGPSVAADKGKSPMPDLDIPAEFLAEDAQARKRLEEEQASERLVQRLRAEDLAQEVLPNVSEERAKELDDLMMRMTETDWLNLMLQVGSNPALARELLGADVNEENFIGRMNAIKEKKKRALADLRYRALKGKPMKKYEVTQMMRNLVKNQWCAAHNGTITMKDVKAMNKQQLIEEYEYICRRLEKDRLLTSVPAATTLPADDPDSASGGSSNPAGSATPMAGSAASNTAGGAFGATVTDSTVTTTAAMDSAGSRRKIGVSPFADSAAGPSPFLSSIAGGPSPSNVSTDQIPIAVLFESTSGGINEFFLESDEEEQIGMSRVVADPDSDDEVIAEIIFRGKSISGDGVVFVDKLPDDEIVDPRVKVETVSESASSPPRSRRKHLGVRSDDFLWDKPVEDFFSSESESDDDMENYIPPLPYGAFKDWEIVSCPPGNNYIHVYYQENRRRKYFRLNPEDRCWLELLRIDMFVDIRFILMTGRLLANTNEWIMISLWQLLIVPPSYCQDVFVAGNIIQTVQAGLRQAYECIASAPIYGVGVSACTARQMVFSSPWLTAKKESSSPLQTALVCYQKLDGIHFPYSCWDEKWLVQEGTALELASPEQTATGKDMSNPLYGCDGLPKTVRVFQFTLDSRSEKLDWFLLHQDWKLLFFDVATSFDSAVHRVHAVSFDAAVLDVASTVSAACIVAAGYIVSAGICDAADIESADLIYRRDYYPVDLRAAHRYLPLDRDLRRHQHALAKSLQYQQGFFQVQALEGRPRYRDLRRRGDQAGTSRAAQNWLNRQKSVVTSRQGSRSLARLRDEMRQASDTQEYPSLIDTFWRTHTVDGEEMKRLEATGEYTEDEINALARGGKLRGHIPGVGRVLPSRATSRPKKRVGPTSSLGIIAGDCIPDEDSPATITQRHFDGNRFPQRYR
ncbi:hypothetical protein Tco_0270340 [Tanacetum coccineum]